MSEWDLVPEQWRDSDPMGRKIENFIYENNQYLVYIRKDQRFPCQDHYKQSNETAIFPTVSCDYCWGFGVKTTAAIVPARLSLGRTANIGPNDGFVRGVPGYLTDYTTVAHFPRAVAPNQKDLVLVCGWNKPTQHIATPPYGRPLKIFSIYMIQQVQDYFMRELSWYSCGLKTLDAIGDHIDNLIIPRLSNLDVLETHTSWKQNSYW